MSDEETKPEAYPEWDTEWREQKAELKTEVLEACDGYPKPVRMAVLNEVLNNEVGDYATSHFEDMYKRGELD